MVRTPDGRVLYGMMISTVVKPFHEVRRWQLRQTAPDAVRLMVEEEATRDNVLEALEDWCGPPVKGGGAKAAPTRSWTRPTGSVQAGQCMPSGDGRT